MSDLNTAQRDALPLSDFGDEQRRLFPILDQDDVDSAAHLIGKAHDPEAVKRRIIAIAKRRGLKVPEAWATGSKEAAMPDFLFFEGHEIKGSGDGNVEGLLVPFGSVDDDGDLFDGETDFDIEPGDRRSGYFRHSLDPRFGNRRIGRGTLAKEAGGILVSGRLNLSDPAVLPVWEAAQKGELGLSSGAPAHLVRRYEIKGGVSHVTHWPIAEWSLTPKPANRHARILSVKEFLGGAPASLGEEFDAAVLACQAFLEHAGSRKEVAAKQGRVLSSDNLTKIQMVGTHLDRMTAHVIDHTEGDTQQQMLHSLGQMQDLIADLLTSGGSGAADDAQRQIRQLQAARLRGLGVPVSYGKYAG